MESHSARAPSICLIAMHLAAQHVEHMADGMNSLGFTIRDLDIEHLFEVDQDLDRLHVVVQSQRRQHADTPLLHATSKPTVHPACRHLRGAMEPCECARFP
jgi:hypothetical protein